MYIEILIYPDLSASHLSWYQEPIISLLSYGILAKYGAQCGMVYDRVMIIVAMGGLSFKATLCGMGLVQ